MANHPQATICHLSVWTDILKKSYNLKSYFLIAEQNQKICGVLPLVHIKSIIFGNHLVSLPFMSSGGIIAHSTDASITLFKKAVKLNEDLKTETIEFRNISNHSSINNILSEQNIKISTEKVRMVLKLPSSSEGLFNSFKSKLRSQIRRPIKEGMKFVIGGSELVEDFYAVFSTNMRDLGSPVHSQEYIMEIMQSLKMMAKIGIVYSHKIPIAAGIIFLFNKKVEIPWASSLREYNKYSPNMLLYWSFLEYVVDNGYHEFDFGRSATDEGTFRFKKQWGANPVGLNWYCYNTGKIDNNNNFKESPINKLMVNIWKRLPLAFANKIGPIIRPSISL